MVWQKLKTFCLDLVFPAVCAHCGKNTQTTEMILCVECLNKIKLNDHGFCPVCMKWLGQGPPSQEATAGRGKCHEHPLRALYAAANYEDPEVRTLIKKLKYDSWSRVANHLASPIHNYLDLVGGNFKEYVLVPVPLHPSKEKARGFNQAELIARILSHRMEVLMKTDLVKRILPTISQTTLENYAAREKNIAGAFQINHKVELPKKIMLVDDIYTSGATMSELARTLKLGGVKEVVGLVFAKAR